MILNWECASFHSGVQFFDIVASKIAPSLRCFYDFELKMCFVPQRRAIFRHRNFKNRSEPEVFCTFWIENALRATAACNFFDIVASKIAPNLRCLVHFDLKMRFAPQRRAIFHFSAKQLLVPATSAPAAFPSLLLEHPEPRIIEKTQPFATFLTCVSSF